MRSDRTKEEFKRAFLKLIEIKPVSKITIQDLLDECGTARQTFYHHFLDKYDLINWIYANEMEQVHFNYSNGIVCTGCYTDIYKMMKEHKSFYVKALSTEGQNSFYEGMYNHLVNLLLKYITEHFGADKLTEKLKFAITFYSNGAVAATRDWVKSGMKRSPEELSLLQLNCMPEELKRFFPNI